MQDAFQDFLWNGGREAEIVLCRESTQHLSEVVLLEPGHDDQIRHERVHGEAHSASPFLSQGSKFCNFGCWWYLCDGGFCDLLCVVLNSQNDCSTTSMSLAAHRKVSKLIGAPPGYVWILVLRRPFWRNPNEFLSFTSLECEENVFFYLLIYDMVWSLHMLYHYSLFIMKSFYTMLFFPSSFQLISFFFVICLKIHCLRWATTMVAP